MRGFLEERLVYDNRGASDDVIDHFVTSTAGGGSSSGC